MLDNSLYYYLYYKLKGSLGKISLGPADTRTELGFVTDVKDSKAHTSFYHRVLVWMFVSLPTFHVENLIPMGMIVGGRAFERWLGYEYPFPLVAQMVKNLPAMQETHVRSLDWEDPLEKGMTTHSSILAWRIPWTEEPGELQSTGSQRVRHDWVTNPFSLGHECKVLMSGLAKKHWVGQKVSLSFAIRCYERFEWTWPTQIPL